MKPNYSSSSNSGFTLIEMLFVVGIMSMFYLLMAANFGAWRTPQYLRNSQNELVTNIQKIRSYSLSGRQIEGNVAKFYILRLDKSLPSNYLLQGIAVDSNFGTDVRYDGTVGNKANITSINLPPTVRISSLSLTKSGTTQDLACVQLGFALPFGKTYITDCYNNDIYTIYTVPSALQAAANARLVITLVGASTSTGTRTVTVYGVSGRVEASQ